ncbi:MAG TPA: ABC transporter ATP-binding protein [Polyangia bacterium]|nr:ABC transporter ATP-binding protein [Polyangia bacterium]
MALLELEGVSKSFRGLRAVSDASFTIEPHTIAALIGPNGAGKTTLFNLIAGVYRPDRGHIRFRERAIGGLPPHRVCRAGIGRTFQLVKPFAGLTVLDNAIVGALHDERTVAGARARAMVALERLGLASKAGVLASHLTLSDRRRLEVARALATRPSLLLLDEMMAGLRPAEIDELVVVLRNVQKQEGVTILLTEHVMRAVMALADQIVVLHHGEVIARGKPDAIVRDRAVLDCYLGEDVNLDGPVP